MDKQYQELEKLAEYARLKGEFKGFLMAILYWDIPKELKTIIESKIKELEDE